MLLFSILGNITLSIHLDLCVDTLLIGRGAMRPVLLKIDIGRLAKKQDGYGEKGNNDSRYFSQASSAWIVIRRPRAFPPRFRVRGVPKRSAATDDEPFPRGPRISFINQRRDVQPEQLPREPPRGRVLCVP